LTISRALSGAGKWKLDTGKWKLESKAAGFQFPVSSLQFPIFGSLGLFLFENPDKIKR
jgi:hypothetical protein